MFTGKLLRWFESHRSAQRRRKNGRRACPLVAAERLEDRTLLSVDALSGFDGLDFAETADGAPPDTIAAVGPGYVVEAVNTDVAIYDKADGSEVFHQDLGDLFAPVGSGTFLSDPVVVYDEAAGRFVVGVLDLNINPLFGIVNSDRFLFAVSDSSDPTQDTNGDGTAFSEMHAVDMTGNTGVFADYPRIGWNADAYFVSFNMFTTGFFNFYDHASIVAINKDSVTDLNNGTLSGTITNRGSSHFTMAPATMHGSNAGDPEFFVEEAIDAGGNPTGQLRVTAMHDALTNHPTFTDTLITVDSYTQPPAAAQQGSSALMETNDTRILNAEWRRFSDGTQTLVAAQTVGIAGDGQAHARWYVFDTSATPTLQQQGTIGVGSGSSSYFPSIAIAPNGDLGMTYIQSSSNEHVSMYVTGQTSADPAGTMQTPVLAKAGETAYSASFDSSPYRAGDYSGITVDPVDGSFWAANQYAKTPVDPRANWGTWIENFKLQSGPQDTTPPGIPQNLQVVSIGTDGTLNLDWADNGEPDLAGYNVYRGTIDGGPYSKINASPLTTSDFADGNLIDGVTYYYVVTAIDTSGNESGDSNQVSAMAVDTQAPADPTGLQAAVSSGQIVLTWNANSESDLAGYNVYRSTTAGSYDTKNPIATVTSTGFTDANVDPDVTYYYVVTAIDISGNASGQSNEASATVPATSGNANDIYDWDMAWSDVERGKWINVTVVVSVKRDSDADGVAESSDADVGGATLTVRMDHYYLGVLVGQTTFSNVGTNGKGQVKLTLKTQLPGDFVATITSLSAGSPLTWNPALDRDNPSYYQGVPNGQEVNFAVPAFPGLGSVLSTFGTRTIVASQNETVEAPFGVAGNAPPSISPRFVFHRPVPLRLATGNDGIYLLPETGRATSGTGRSIPAASNQAAMDALFALLSGDSGLSDQVFNEVLR